MYLDELDQWVKRTLKRRYYLRYVDDMVLLSPDPAVLVRWRAAIEAFLRERLGLRLRAAVVSYSGHLRQGAAWREWARVWEAYPWLGALFQHEGWVLAERFPAARIARASRFRRQYWALVRRAGERCLVFCPVGRFIEFRGPQRLAARPILGLRTAHLPRGGFALAAGFPRRLASCYRRRALQHGCTVVEVREGDAGGGC